MGVIERWIRALTSHDLEAAAACFAPHYWDEAPARRGERVRGRQEVRKNFARLFDAVPDLAADVIGIATEDDKVWVEWRLHGTRVDGFPFEFVGVNIFGVEDDQIAWGRIYTELVRDSGTVDEQLERMAGPSDPVSL